MSAEHQGQGLLASLADTLTSLRSLSASTIIASLALAWLLATVVGTIRSWRRLSHVPGPFLASVTKYWQIRESLAGRQPFAIQRAHERYGSSLVRIGPNELATSDPDVLRRMTAVRSSYTRGPFYAAFRFEPGKDHLVSQRDDDVHMRMRNKMAAGYSGKENESMERTIDANVARLVELLERHYLSTEQHYRPVDFAQKAQYFTLDVVADLAFGQPFGYLEQDKDMFDFIKTTRSFFPVALIMGIVPYVVSVLHSPLLRSLLPKDSDDFGFGAFIGVANKKVAERFGPNAIPHPDMLGSFIRHGLSQEECSREAVLNVVAGSDTTATTIRVTMWHLLSNPAAYSRLQREIDGAAISSPVTDAEARRLPYLQACIREGLRIRPPVPGPTFKQVPPGGDVIDGRRVPGGTQIAQSVLGCQHSRETFGEDAGLFVPERWLDADAARVARMSGVVDLVFSAGKWQCLGRAAALMELNKIFVELLRRFDFAMACPERPASITYAGVWIIEDFPVRVTRRDNT